MTSVPAWEKDDRPGVKVFSKICPDCQVMDAQQNDPRKGLRHASEFGLHYRAEDGLQPFCRHHMKQRRRHERATPAPALSGRLSAAGIRALQPADPANAETPSNGHESAAPPDPALSATVQLIEVDLAALTARLEELESARAQASAPGEVTARKQRELEERLTALEEARPETAKLQDLSAMQGRLTNLEDAATAPLPGGAEELVSRLQAAHGALASRVAALERAEKEEDEGAAAAAGHESANTRSIRRWTKQLGKEVGNLSTRVERAEGKAQEAVRMAQAAGRINAGRSAETTVAPPIDVDALTAKVLSAVDVRIADNLTALPPITYPAATALKDEILRTVQADLEQRTQHLTTTLEERLTRLAPLPSPPAKEDVMMQIANRLTDGPAPGAPGDRSPEAVHATVRSVLARYTAGLRNVAQIERDGLLETDDVTMIAERIQQRSADELCAYIGDLCRQTTSEEKK